MLHCTTEIIFYESRKEVCGNQPTEDSNATADIIIYVFAVVVVVLAVMMTIYLKKVFKKREKRGGNCLF